MIYFWFFSILTMIFLWSVVFVTWWNYSKEERAEIWHDRHLIQQLTNLEISDLLNDVVYDDYEDTFLYITHNYDTNILSKWVYNGETGECTDSQHIAIDHKCDCNKCFADDENIYIESDGVVYTYAHATMELIDAYHGYTIENNVMNDPNGDVYNGLRYNSQYRRRIHRAYLKRLAILYPNQKFFVSGTSLSADLFVVTFRDEDKTINSFAFRIDWWKRIVHHFWY